MTLMEDKPVVGAWADFWFAMIEVGGIRIGGSKNNVWLADWSKNKLTAVGKLKEERLNKDAEEWGTNTLD